MLECRCVGGGGGGGDGGPVFNLFEEGPSHAVLFFIQDWEVVVLGKLKWDLSPVMANDFLDHILQRLPLPQTKVGLVKKRAQTFTALCACTGIICVVRDSLHGEGGAVAGLQGSVMILSHTEQSLGHSFLGDWGAHPQRGQDPELLG